MAGRLSPTAGRGVRKIRTGESVLHLLTRLIEESGHTVLIQANVLPQAVYGAETFLGAVRDALGRGVAFRLLLGPDFRSGSMDLPQLLGDAAFVSSAPLPQAFMVVDGVSVYYESAGLPVGRLRSPSYLSEAPESAYALVSHLADRVAKATPLEQWTYDRG